MLPLKRVTIPAKFYDDCISCGEDVGSEVERLDVPRSVEYVTIDTTARQLDRLRSRAQFYASEASQTDRYFEIAQTALGTLSVLREEGLT